MQLKIYNFSVVYAEKWPFENHHFRYEKPGKTNWDLDIRILREKIRWKSLSHVGSAIVKMV